MRFLRLGTVYDGFVTQVLAATPRWRELAYADLYQRFVDGCFAESDHHARHARRLGHVAENHFISIEPLQRLWAREQGRSCGANWLAEITLAQVAEFRPDVVFLDDLYVIDRPFREQIRRTLGRPVRLVGWRAAPTDDFSGFEDLDLLLTSIAGMAEQFRRHGCRAEVLQHSFEPSLLDRVDTFGPRDIPFSFAGGLSSLHPQRAATVESLLQRTPLEIWGCDTHVRLKDQLRWQLYRAGLYRPSAAKEARLRARTAPLRYPGRVHPAQYGLEYYRVLARSKIVFNQHIGAAGQDASNMRLYEVTGMGACLVTDRKRNLGELFEPGREVVAYDNLDDCIDQVHHLLAHEPEREAIARAGQQRTLRQHRFGQRVERLFELLEHAGKRAA